ncbi:hypothetical protein QR680_013566 [Steinernema hermaphroditum]|uniref:Probable imidazolonepropionase n=1 Tax=Steinernema hermaphroditum TaxID=289476 RepID=A0AA39I898_9BILA|nr:hypothetical protein QR680_013566 [Steinernema hermaphroditum]
MAAFAEGFGSIIFNIRQIVQITDDPNCLYLRGSEMSEIKVIESESDDLAVLVDLDGVISHIGCNTELKALAKASKVKESVDAEGGCLVPGLVDGHTHPVFAGDRVHEFAMKLAGASYMEVQQAGGGIHFTTKKTREATEAELLESLEEVGVEMLKAGTTTLEAKSGYGLDTETEMKMLDVIEMANGIFPLDFSATFCGAHAIPRDSDEWLQTELIVNEMIPRIVEEKAEGRLTCVENIDVFCEKGVFGIDSSKRILEAGKSAGLRINFHADELHPLGGAEMGASIGARAMSHLEEISATGIFAMAESKSVAVLLPTTAYMLRLKPPPARDMIDQGVIVALGSDFNPNAFCLSMPTVMHLACVQFRMSMPEALVAATLNAAYSIGRSKRIGAITVGRQADLLVLEARKWEHLIYRFGCHSMVIKHVIKNGKVVFSKC